MGRPQYGSVAYARRLTRATSSRQATSRGQARHTDTRAVSSARLPAPAASARTCAGPVATGVSGVAGSSGQPVPGGTGPAGTGLADTGLADTGLADTGLADTGLADTGLADTGLADTGLADAGLADPR